jgi:hypothetical protein
MSKCFVVMGMHRSGSSLVAHALHSWGVYMGSNLMEPDAANLDGFFEEWDFVHLNNELLSEKDSCWHAPVKIISGNEECKKLIEKHRRTLWGFKDNRTAFTFGAYEKYFLPNEVIIVVCVRDIDEIVKSVLRIHRAGLDPDQRNEDYVRWLCEQHYKAIAEITQRHPSITVNYKDMSSFSNLYIPELRRF